MREKQNVWLLLCPARLGDQTGIGGVAAACQSLFSQFKEGKAAAQTAPLPEDPGPRAVDLKGAAYFLDASMAGICEIPVTAWLQPPEDTTQRHVFVILLEHARLPEQTNLAISWIGGSAASLHHLRITEVATCIAGHVRNMGFDARIHVAGDPEIDIEKLSVLAGLTVRTGDVVSASKKILVVKSMQHFYAAYEPVDDDPWATNEERSW